MFFSATWRRVLRTPPLLPGGAPQVMGIRIENDLIHEFEPEILWDNGVPEPHGGGLTLGHSGVPW